MATTADLIMRQGEIAARGAERSGEIWGRAVEQLGQIGAGAFQQYAAQKEEKKRVAMFDEAMASYDPANPMDFYRKASVAVGPEVANQSIRAFAALAEQQRLMQEGQPADTKKFAEQVRFLKSMEQKSPGWLQAHWDNAYTALGPQAKSLYNVDLTPEWSEEYRGILEAFNPDDPTGSGEGEIIETVGPGGIPIKRRVPESELAQGVPVWKAPAGTSAGPAVGSFEDYVVQKYGDRPAPQQIAQARAEWGALGRAPKEPAPPPAERVLNPEGVVLSSYGIREREEVRREAADRGIPVFATAAAQTKGVTLAGIVADANELTGLLALPEVKEAIGPVAGRWNQLKAKVVDLDPDVQRAIQLMTSLSDTELRKRSGAQINEAEMKRILRFALDPNRPLGHNVTAVNGLLKSADRDFRVLAGQSPSGGSDSQSSPGESGGEWTEMPGGIRIRAKR